MHNIHTLAIERKELRKTKNYYPTKKMRNFNKSGRPSGQFFFCDSPKTVKINSHTTDRGFFTYARFRTIQYTMTESQK